FRHLNLLLNSGCRPEEICVLARKNDILKRFSQYCDSLGIATHLHTASGFYDRREINDALSFLKFLVNPHDNLNFLTLLRSPWCRIPDRILIEWTKGKPKSLWAFVVNSENPVIQWLKSVYELQDEMGTSSVFERCLIERGLFDLSHLHDSSGRRES